MVPGGYQLGDNGIIVFKQLPALVKHFMSNPYDVRAADGARLTLVV